ncbi:DNA-binding protein [Photobacterium japonica]|uniref:PPC domain-containing DNA-binding protein n=1 Tax=Photobacterium japonica TaxID=2910235 RepID=UPI003D13F76A
MSLLIPHAFRLTQGQDLKMAIQAYVQQHHLQAGSLLSGIGCLSHAEIRLANANHVRSLPGPLEIVSLVGTLTPEHVHLHIVVADAQGKVCGGHLMEGSMVSHTAEVCLAAYENLSFCRAFDPQTGYTELVVTPR